MPRTRKTKKSTQASLFSIRKVSKRPSVAPKPTTTLPKRKPLAPGKRRWLSATTIELWRRCPRCFWLQVNMQIRQPEGIVSRLANRFDVVLKEYFNHYRGTPNLPPLVQSKITGRLESPFQEKYFHSLPNSYGFLGKLDECVIEADHRYTPIDHKTASSDPTQRELIPAYQFQLDCYAWLLESAGKPTSGNGHLIYYFPVPGRELQTGFPMQITVKTLKTHPDVVQPAIDQAIATLEGPLPPSKPDCPFCSYVSTRKTF